jgi:hypothetical protein
MMQRDLVTNVLDAIELLSRRATLQATDVMALPQQQQLSQVRAILARHPSYRR